MSISKVIGEFINGLKSCGSESEKWITNLNEEMDRKLDLQAKRHAEELNQLVGDSPYDGTVKQNEANKLKVEAIRLNNEKTYQKIDAILDRK
ncbi:MAG: hypothetical protein ACI88H_002615 [Cocleimonas sp.]|jgi:hypothetical protein